MDTLLSRENHPNQKARDTRGYTMLIGQWGERVERKSSFALWNLITYSIILFCPFIKLTLRNINNGRLPTHLNLGFAKKVLPNIETSLANTNVMEPII